MIGIVLDTEPIKQSNKDPYISIVVADPATHTGTHSGDMKDEGMVVTMFRPAREDFPCNISPGCPILFRGVKVCHVVLRLFALMTVHQIQRQNQGQHVLSEERRRFE